MLCLGIYCVAGQRSHTEKNSTSNFQALMHAYYNIISCMLMTLHLAIPSSMKHAQLAGDMKIKRSQDHPYNNVTQSVIYLL